MRPRLEAVAYWTSWLTAGAIIATLDTLKRLHHNNFRRPR